jgi:hypothetical protein
LYVLELASKLDGAQRYVLKVIHYCQDGQFDSEFSMGCAPLNSKYRSVEVIKLQLKKSLELKEPLQKVSQTCACFGVSKQQ